MPHPIFPAKRKIELTVLIIFAVAMAYVEAMVVVYLRRFFPLTDWSHLSSYKDLCVFITRSGIKWSEQTREFATLVMLVSVAFFFGKNRRERVAGFLIAFGVWDIFYYLFLYLWLRWPENLFARDILFLIPCPWVSPIIVPVCISLVMISGGLYLLKQLNKYP